MEITKQELKELRAAKDVGEWNEVVDKIKSDRDGAYPPDWWRVMADPFMSQGAFDDGDQ